MHEGHCNWLQPESWCFNNQFCFFFWALESEGIVWLIRVNEKGLGGGDGGKWCCRCCICPLFWVRLISIEETLIWWYWSNNWSFEFLLEHFHQTVTKWKLWLSEKLIRNKVVKFEYWSHRSDCDPLWLCHFSHTLFLLSPHTRAHTRRGTGTQNTPYIPTHSLIFSYSHNSEQTQNQDCVIQTYSNRLSRTHSHTHKNACTHTHTHRPQSSTQTLFNALASSDTEEFDEKFSKMFFA